MVYALQLEEIINIEALDRLKDAFSRADKDGQRKLTETQFQGVLREALGMRNQQEDQVRAFVYERGVMHVCVCVQVDRKIFDIFNMIDILDTFPFRRFALFL